VWIEQERVPWRQHAHSRIGLVAPWHRFSRATRAASEREGDGQATMGERQCPCRMDRRGASAVSRQSR
jgi:hypothetical protein